MNIDEIKAFILWARSNNIASINIEGISVSFFPAPYNMSDFMTPELRREEEDLALYSSVGAGK